MDGCAIFYRLFVTISVKQNSDLCVCRTSKFVLVKEQLVEFNQLAIEHANGHEDMLNR